LQSAEFQDWAVRMKERPDNVHRKLWEFCYIAQALKEQGMLQPGRRGLGFAVGQEPLADLFASFGCSILATDLDESAARQAGWVDSGQHASGLASLNRRQICPPGDFARRVQFRVVDMNHVPADLSGFDFIWSSCSIEHLGTLQAGIDFMVNMARCLRRGGVAVHTTEFNCSSNEQTLASGSAVIFRRRDLLRMKARLEAEGHQVAPFDFDTGHDPADLFVDEPPYKQQPHLKLRLGGFVATSIGIIVQAGDPPSRFRRVARWVGKLFRATPAVGWR
jgi:hypothetical protein